MICRILTLLFLSLLVACDDRSDDELKSWMEQTRRQVHPVPTKLISNTTFQPFRYDAKDRTDPYDFKKISDAAPHLQNGGIRPDLERHREPLENYPLESLKHVGSLRKTGKVLGLIEAEKIIYQVGIGSHLGQDFGRVVAITDNAIEIDEMLQEAGGVWITRRARLALQERHP